MDSSDGYQNRPCAIVLAIEGKGTQAKTVTVAPITHTPPSDPLMAIEIPPRVKQHLGLDAKRSWIVVDEFNEFAWPGFDLRPVPGKPSRYDYGFLPPALFATLIERILELRRTGGAVSSARDTL